MAGVVSEEGETRDAGNTELTWRSERDRKETACAGTVVGREQRKVGPLLWVPAGEKTI